MENLRGNTEKKEVVDDNARKFTVGSLSAEFLLENDATSFALATDWLETDENSERKVALKRFDDGNVQRLLIAKVIVDGNRTSEKTNLSQDEYDNYLKQSILRVVKKRHEFDYVQESVNFSIKYDVFYDDDLKVLEVDALGEQARNAFNPLNFPSRLKEVTGDIRYYGYRVADFLK